MRSVYLFHTLTQLQTNFGSVDFKKESSACQAVFMFFPCSCVPLAWTTVDLPSCGLDAMITVRQHKASLLRRSAIQGLIMIVLSCSGSDKSMCSVFLFFHLFPTCNGYKASHLCVRGQILLVLGLNPSRRWRAKLPFPFCARETLVHFLQNSSELNSVLA